jgi:hypothetical protein
VADFVGAEQRREALLLGDLADHGAPAAPRGKQAKRRRDGGLAHAALARYHHEPLVEKRAHRAGR